MMSASGPPGRVPCLPKANFSQAFNCEPVVFVPDAGEMLREFEAAHNRSLTHVLTGHTCKTFLQYSSCCEALTSRCRRRATFRLNAFP